MKSKKTLEQRRLFLQNFEAKETNYYKLPQAIRDWQYVHANRSEFTYFFDHPEVFKIDGGYLHTVSPYEPAYESQTDELIDRFLNQLGYIRSSRRIYNEHAVTFYKVISRATRLRTEMKALGFGQYL